LDVVRLLGFGIINQPILTVPKAPICAASVP